MPMCTTNLLFDDVLEVIAEYACATVTGAATLRAANKGYRRAVDTTVRRWVYEDQPELRPSPNDDEKRRARATLKLHAASRNLDAVRIAFTCDEFVGIVRLVVVAFALDGAKDEVREGDECGPRPVTCANSPVCSDTAASDLTLDFFQSWLAPPPQQQTVVPRSPNHVSAFVRCLRHLTVSDATLTDDMCAAVEQCGLWSAVTQLGCTSLIETSSAYHRLGRVIAVLAPQLTMLMLDSVSAILCPAIAICRKLELFRANGPVGAASLELSRALAASGSPLRSVCADIQSDHISDMLQTIPTLRRVEFPHAQGSSFIPQTASTHFSWTGSSADRATAADLASTCPVAERVSLDLVAADVVVLDPRTLTLPSSLQALDLRAPPDAAAAVIHRLAAIGPAHLPNLATVSVATAPLPVVVKMSPLAIFAPMLKALCLTNAESGGEDGAPVGDVADLEAALAQLVNLEIATVPCLPSPRCFLGGSHKQLRILWIKRAHAPAADASFAKLVRACPLLVAVMSEYCDVPRIETAGWRVRGCPVADSLRMQRHSYELLF